MRHPSREPDLITEFPIGAARTVVAEMSAARRWAATDAGWRLRLSDEQYVGGVSDEVRTARIAGYPVPDRWLAFRSGRALAVGEIVGLQRTVAALQASIAVVTQIDDLAGDVLGSPA